MEQSEFGHRRAPYAPISSLREFFERIRNVGVPVRVDRRFLQKLNVASSNEWALLSALKFLEILDGQGEPTHAYRRLQTSDRFEETLRHLVQVAYKPLLDLGGLSMTQEDLENYFRVASSPSQAKNAARFFREVCKLASIGETAPTALSFPPTGYEPPANPLEEDDGGKTAPRPTTATGDLGSALVKPDLLLRTRAALVEKLPVCRPEWNAADYEAICRRFLEMLRLLDS